MPGGQEPQRGEAAAASEQGKQEEAGGRIAQRLAARVRVVTEQAVGGEGGADEGVGEGDEQYPAFMVRP